MILLQPRNLEGSSKRKISRDTYQSILSSLEDISSSNESTGPWLGDTDGWIKEDMIRVAKLPVLDHGRFESQKVRVLETVRTLDLDGPMNV
jgi:hypothetical protein